MSHGRLLAAQALLTVEEGGHVEDFLAAAEIEEAQHRRQAWFLALGVLRHRSEVDALLRPRLRQPLQALDAGVRAALRIAGFEALHAKTPRHAVVNEAVELVRALKLGRAAGLVNAVLRRIDVNQDFDERDRLNHPDWLIDRWQERYGEEATRAWCDTNNTAPPTFAVTGDAPDNSWVSALEAEPVRIGGAVVPNLYRIGMPGPVTLWPGFREGTFWIQDAAAVHMADLIAPMEGMTVLDACAAPGGKTCRLASRGAVVTSVDRDAERLERVRQNLTRTGFEATLVQHDWSQGPLEGSPTFDAVLIDAPCTGLGTLRRHPEIRWRRQESDIAGAAALQAQILAAAATHVKIDGHLVYSVCSSEPEEGAEQVRGFLEAHRSFELVEERSTTPPAGDEDAHYGARLRRIR